jgi:hypothetical protein
MATGIQEEVSTVDKPMRWHILNIMRRSLLGLAFIFACFIPIANLDEQHDTITVIGTFVFVIIFFAAGIYQIYYQTKESVFDFEMDRKGEHIGAMIVHKEDSGIFSGSVKQIELTVAYIDNEALTLDKYLSSDYELNKLDLYSPIEMIRYKGKLHSSKYQKQFDYSELSTKVMEYYKAYGTFSIE